MIHKATIASFVAFAGQSMGLTAQDFVITEIYPGITGEDGTRDWFEVTNAGIMPIDTSTLFWDSGSPGVLSGAFLQGFVLDAGETAVFLIADDLGDVADPTRFSDVIDEFRAVWGPIANVGITNGGGADLDENGDSVSLSADGGLTFPVTVAFGGGFADSGSTIDVASGTPTASVLGVNGAFRSFSFFNSSIGDANDRYDLIGSPGVVPAPASAALLGLGGLAAMRRRR